MKRTTNNRFKENARLTETMSEFQVRAASLATDKTRRKEFGVDEAEDGDGAGEQHALTTERDTLKANLTATNQSLDESNQRIDTLSFEVSSLLAQNAELEHLLSKDWLITTDKQTECIGVGESAAQLLNREIQACQRHFTPTALLGRHRRQDRIPKRRGKKLSLAPLARQARAQHDPSQTTIEAEHAAGDRTRRGEAAEGDGAEWSSRLASSTNTFPAKSAPSLHSPPPTRTRMGRRGVLD
ncbi:hypothetical protein BLNAU_19357 [Blattamonas nauphoetae]|uniref:Uncharacterized protein n=1 Tax=Blattamonas nauphoetae TaxID=2049346 RepID=A0ABQ9X275_9EUKA|nr:hypothetical protein BLNAU_19357 [Blattamonas nauphoetae]